MSRSRVLRTALAFVIAASIGYVIASLFYTVNNLIRLSAVGADISFADAVRTIGFDLRGMAPSIEWTQFGSVIFIGLAIAFPVAALLRRWALRTSWQKIAPILYPLAGATAMAVILAASYPKYEVFAYPGTRGTWGVLAQCVAGALAGYLFHVLVRSRTEAQPQ